MGRGVLVALVVGAMVTVLAIGGLSTFTVTPIGPAHTPVHCGSPFYGSGSGLSGEASRACDDEARRRAERGGLVALAIGAAGFVAVRLIRPRQ
jgi:hypothetical protein